MTARLAVACLFNSLESGRVKVATRFLYLVATLLCFAGVFLPRATAQQTDELRKKFQSVKAKAEKGMPSRNTISG